ncbi:uncharacterized protein [Musca autumnalis]|uniref:uncharacterized protein n=1 Tax=Musca autumnalis TaxID=221902 RepID=UPI003CEACF5C
MQAQSNITRSWEDTCHTLKTIAKNHIGYEEKTERKEWISDNTWNLIKERNGLKQKSTQNPWYMEQYKATAKLVKRSARNDKRQYAEKMAREAEAAAGANNMKDLYKVISRMTNQSSNYAQAVKDIDGKLLTNVDQQINRWKQHFESISNIFEENDVQSDQNMETNQNDDETIDADPPNIAEIATAINKLKKNKAPGEDGIPPELLQVDATLSATIIHPHILEAWENETLPETWTKGTIIKLPKKDDLKVCDNWRGITLLNTVYKIIATIINDRLQSIEKSLRDEQAGFRPHRSCVDQTNTLRVIIEQSLEWRTPLYLVFVDFRKAFDSIHLVSIKNETRAPKNYTNN